MKKKLSIVLIPMMTLSLSSCQSDSEFIGDAAAHASLMNTTHFFSEEFEFDDGLPLLRQVNDWLADPDPIDLKRLGDPGIIVLDATSDRLDAAIYRYGRGPGMFMSKVEGWGHRCVQFRESPLATLTINEIECPEELPEDPNALIYDLD
ncbi:hypothetical protein [Glutamicibacter sp. X7]